MTSTLKKIKAPIAQELRYFETYFKSVIKSNVRILDLINRYILKRKGKEIRPILTLLFAKALGEVNSKTYIGASLIQLLHTATLLHDDVVDNAYVRRGIFSVNALWKPKIAVLVGDYFLSKGMLVALENDAYDLLQLASNAVKNMSEGELLQLQKARHLDITEEEYFEIIGKKTASLIGSCVSLGAKSVNVEANTLEKLQELGLNMGMAFQLKDDLLDFKKSSTTGKLRFNDIKEKKLTLPLIYTLTKVNARDKKAILRNIIRHGTNPKKIAEIMAHITAEGGIEYTQEKMMDYRQKSLKIVRNTLNESPARQSILELISYIIGRQQ